MVCRVAQRPIRISDIAVLMRRVRGHLRCLELGSRVGRNPCFYEIGFVSKYISLTEDEPGAARAWEHFVDKF